MWPRWARRAGLLLACLLQSSSCSASAAFREGNPQGFSGLPSGPNTDKLLRGIAALAPPLSEYPEILEQAGGGEGPRAWERSSAGARFADFNSEAARRLQAEEGASVGEGGVGCAASGKGSAGGGDDADWDSEEVVGDLKTLLRVIEGGSGCGMPGTAGGRGAWDKGAVAALHQRVTACKVWWHQPPFARVAPLAATAQPIGLPPRHGAGSGDEPQVSLTLQCHPPRSTTSPLPLSLHTHACRERALTHIHTRTNTDTHRHTHMGKHGHTQTHTDSHTDRRRHTQTQT